MGKERIVAIFTGSRHLPDEVYFEHCEDLIVLKAGPDIATAFVGDCPTGLDKWVRWNCAAFGITLRVFKADWNAHGRSAGPRRNQRMVDAAAVEAKRLGLPLVCFAFPMGASRGTRDCMRRAAKAGAEVRVTEVPA